MKVAPLRDKALREEMNAFFKKNGLDATKQWNSNRIHSDTLGTADTDWPRDLKGRILGVERRLGRNNLNLVNASSRTKAALKRGAVE